MRKIKILFLITILSASLSNFKSYSNNISNYLIDEVGIKDSLLVLKSGNREIIKIDSDKNIESRNEKNTSYHIINFSTSEIIFFYDNDGSKWKSQSFEYFATSESSEMIEFDTTSEISRSVGLDINPYNTIAYSFKNGIILAFSELEELENKELAKLGIYDWKDSYEQIENSKTITINERIEDYEYLDFYRKESYKKAVNYIHKILGKQNPPCKMVRRSSYNPSSLSYLGYQGYRIKLYAEYDCNQDYINESYFWVDVYYLGYDKWSFDLVDQRLTH
mgnify:CR=1 FL=1